MSEAPNQSTEKIVNTEQSTHDDAIRHLLLSFPELDIAGGGKDVVDSLVEGAICQMIGRQGVEKMFTVGDVAAGILELAGLTYETAELVHSFERLAERGRLSFRDDSHRAFVFNEQAYRETHDAFRARAAEWDTVHSAWIDEIRLAHGLEYGQADMLWEALNTFAAELIASHAAEAAAFLYADDAAGQTRFYDALSHRVPQVDDLVPPELRDIAKVEFPRFFDFTNTPRTDFVLSRLRASFFFHLLSVDPSASELVRDHLAGKVFYLDSNFVFRLLGFHGTVAAFGAFTVVEVSRELNCRLVVTRETVDEYVRVVRALEAQLRAAPIGRETYLRIAAEQPAHDGEFMAAYYRELQSGRVRNVGEFALRWTNVRAHLQDWNIEIDEDAALSEEEQRSDAFRDAVSKLGQWQPGKNPDAVEHDVYMLHLIQRKRGRSQTTPAQTKTWFITFDRQLTRFAAYYATEGSLTAVLLAEDWLQIARPFLPRTENYAGSFVAMLANPLLFSSANVPFAHMAQALSRLERYSELPPAVVSAIVADAQFVKAFAATEDSQDAQHLLEVKLQELATSAFAANDQLKDTLASALTQIATMQEHLDTLRDAEAAARGQGEKWRNEASREKAARQTAERGAEVRLSEMREDHARELASAICAAATAAADKASSNFRSEVRRLWKWAAVFFVGLLLTFGVAVSIVAVWPISTTRLLVIGFWLLVAWTALLAIPKGWKAVWTVPPGVIAVIGLIYQTHQAWNTPAPAESAQRAEQSEPAPQTSVPNDTPVQDSLRLSPGAQSRRGQ